MPRVNPDIFVWARETAGLSLENAAQKLGIGDARGVSADDRLRAYEAGSEIVSRPLLLKMAKQYRRPLLSFYLSSPPAKGERGEDFRNLPDRDVNMLPLVDALVRDIRARQEMVKAILVDDEDATPLPFIGSIRLEDGVGTALATIRQSIGLDLVDFRAQRLPESAFALLRERVEAAGVFVVLAGNLGSHHSAISVSAFRGFALADPIAPFIVINDQDAKSAWSFTLLHELAHLWLGTTGISGGSGDTQIERFCNDIASNFLLPNHEGVAGLDGNSTDAEIIRLINEFASERNLSNSMVAYRLFREGILTDAQWSSVTSIFRSQWLLSKAAQKAKAKETEGGVSYYTVRRHRLGGALLKFVARNLNGGTLSPTKAGKVLGVKARNVNPLLSGAALGSSQAA